MDFEEETVELETETVEFETETTEFEIDDIEFEEDVEERDFDLYTETETTETEDFEVEFSEDVEEAEFEMYDEAENEVPEFEEDIDEASYDFSDGVEYDDGLTDGQRAEIAEMNQSGEMDDYLPSQLGDATYLHSGRTLDETINVDMPYNTDASYDTEDFIAQAHMQEEGLNSMTVAEYLDNYENYQANGRSPEGTEMQEQYREGLEASISYDLMEADPSLTVEEADRLAAEELQGGAALHNPDQVAGGDPTDIHAYGSGSANSAMGSLWGHDRAQQMYDQIKEQTAGMTRDEMENTYLNIRFNIHEKGN